MLKAAEKLDINYLIELAFIESSPKFLDLQREQLNAGLRNDEKFIYNIETGSDEYSHSYAKVKGKKKPIDLNKTGAWQDDLFVDVREQELYIASMDSKDELLNTNYGEQILGLGDKKKTEFIPILRTNFLEGVTNKLNNK